MGLAYGLGPVEAQYGRGHFLGFVAARINSVFACPQRFLPYTAMAGPNDRAELKCGARGVLRRQADVCLDYRHLALLDDQHGHFLDLHQKRI